MALCQDRERQRARVLWMEQSSTWAAAVMGAWRGASTGPVDGAAGATAVGALQVVASAPSLTPTDNGELQVYFYGAQSSIAPTITLSNSLNQRFDARFLKEGFSLGFGVLAAPFADSASLTYPATASITGTAVMTAQAVLLLPSSDSPNSTPTGTPPVTRTATLTPVPTNTRTVVPTPLPTLTTTPSVAPTMTSTPTSAATPIPGITFVGAGSLTDSSLAMSTVTVGAPSGVRPGDIMLAQILIYDGGATDVPTPPAGWTSIRHDAVNNGNKATSWLYFKIAGANEPSSYGWSIGSNWAAGATGAWRGTSSSPLDNSSGAVAISGNPVTVSAPSLSPTNNNELQVYFYGAQSGSAPAIAISSALNQRFDSRSSKEGFALAFADLREPQALTISRQPIPRAPAFPAAR